MNDLQPFLLSVKDCSRIFAGNRPIFPPVDITVRNGDIKGITGLNGSGKSTLISMIAGILKPSTGSISLSIHQQHVDSEQIPMHCGLVSPYLQMYEEYTPAEHARLFCELSGIPFDNAYHELLLELSGMKAKEHTFIKTFSSGMKQRIKYILAMIRKPEILLLDEPTANLDSLGVSVFKNIVSLQQSMGGGIIIATNESDEAALCDDVISLS